MASDNAIRKGFQISAGTSLAAGLRFNVLLGGSAVLLFWTANGFSLECTPWSLLLAFVQALLAVSYTVIGFRVMERSMTLYALFQMTGSMVIPYLFGAFVLGEGVSLPQLFGLMLIIAAILFSRKGDMRASGGLLLLCAAVFLFSGAASAITKLHQAAGMPAATSPLGFVVLVNLAKFLLSCAALKLLPCTGEDGSARIPPKKLLPVLACTAVSGTAYFLQLVTAGRVHATVMYPLLTGGSVLCSTLFAVLFFGEKLTRRMWISLLLCLTGSCFFL